VSTKPRWVRAIQKAILAKPGITEIPRCGACARLMAPCDMRGDLCRDCQKPASDAFHFSDDASFMLWDDSE
jgi:hypothetical protein